MNAWIGTLLAGSWMMAHTPGFAGAADPLAVRAQAVLKTHCHRCHGNDGSHKGDFNYVLDRDQLISRGKIVPGDAAESELFQRVRDGEMPPPGKSARPSKNDVLVLRQWIEAGAPTGSPATAKRDFISDQEILRWIRADVQAVEPRLRRYVRYFTLVPLANAGLREEQLQAYRHALAHLLNSLSWHPRITPPRPLDAGQTVYRIDLRHYKWTAREWERLENVYPYRLAGGELLALARDIGCELPVLRADWFVATAARPPLYHDLLQLPTTDRALERLLQVDVPADIQEETVARAGFNGSGVSKNNRVIERHDAAYGAYWRSYDFADNTGRHNVFEHPLGPLTGATSFEPAGGEIIFHLPNGLHAYLLVDGLGRRVDKAPIEIVSDPKRPDQRVENGLSCMSCHARGLIPRADQVRGHVAKNASAFSRADRDSVRGLYPSKARMQTLLKEDNERFLRALARTGTPADAAEPSAAVAQRYEAPLDLRAAAAEVGLPVQEFAARLSRAPALARSLGPLHQPGGTVQRQVFQESFADLVREFRLVEDSPARTLADHAGTTNGGFVGHAGPVTCLAFSRDGKRAVSGGEDRTVRVWDVATGQELSRFEGHRDEIAAVAFAPDGRRVLSAARDRTLYLWDVATGKVLGRFIGNTDCIRALAFSPDGVLAASGGDDLVIRLWRVRDGLELRCLPGHVASVYHLTFAPDSRRLLSAGGDATVRLWDLATGREVRRFVGHRGAVYSIAFSPDGKRALSGGNDRTVRCWDVGSGAELRCFRGHANAVMCVAFSPDGRRVLSGSSQYESPDRVLRQWDVETGRALTALEAAPSARIRCIAFAPDGRLALTGGSGTALRLWQLTK